MKNWRTQIGTSKGSLSNGIHEIKKEWSHILIIHRKKGYVHQIKEDVAILDIYVSNTKAWKFIKNLIK